MLVVDTSAWIEWLIGSPLGKAIEAQVPPREQIIVPTMVQHELAKWMTRERGEDASDELIAFTMKCSVVDLDTGLAMEAAEICRRHRLATADAIVYATARRANAQLLTCDAHFKGLDQVIYIPKASN